ncbi:MAG: LuxR C-terminal-related transcriptional regulator [Thermoleophilaceae bacterium]
MNARAATAAPALAGGLAKTTKRREEQTKSDVAGALGGVREALARLRGAGSTAQLLSKATVELCRHCGFDRSIFFSVEGSQIAPESVHMEAHPSRAAEFLDLVRHSEPQLMPLLHETDMVRQRKAVLIEDARNDERTHQAIVRACQTRSYVAAPVTPNGRVVGFFAADHFFARKQATPLDREVIWAFAEGFTHAYECMLMHGRLRAQSRRLHEMLAAMESAIAESDGEQLAIPAERPPSGVEARHLRPADFEDPTHGLLTRREREVLALMAEGATNAMIAERLVISPGTVKSHVKHILRKLRAANRAEAVSRYLRLSSLRA